jgi:ABC-type multidrug transport system ATPase subunit
LRLVAWRGGAFRLNGSDYSRHRLKECAGYVMQDDVLNPALTVLETLRYTRRRSC